MSTSHTSTHNYRGKHGRPIIETTAVISASQISSSLISIGAAISSGDMSFALAGREENGTGRVVKVLLNITNGTASNVTEGFRLWLFNTAPISQTSGTILSGMDISMAYNYGYIDLNNADPLATSNSISITNCVYDFVCAAENNIMYGILEATSDTLFDASASMTCRLIIEQD